ncbi:MAG: UvrD-helicase domain-containing protein [Deltaproteobacteria bacterium]|nr:UvrD-helicase domain-containing protein [Deltaproteobacteria bacterium]
MSVDWIVVRDGRPDLDPERLRLTPAQAGACAVDREVLVRAGAGSGKTATLSTRYLRLLVGLAWDAARSDPDRPAPDLDRVLVLTFTDKAAREMADRCHARLLALARALDQLPSPPSGLNPASFAPFRASLHHLLDHFDSARISTFHGFCARLLREFPAETDTPPGFEVLDEDEARPLYEEAVDACVSDLLDAGGTDLDLLLDAFGALPPVKDALLFLVANRGTLLPGLARHAAGQGTLDAFLARAAIRPGEASAHLEARVRPLVEAIAAAVVAGPSTPFLARAANLAGRLRTLPTDPLALYDLLHESVGLFTTGEGTPRTLTHASVLGLKASWSEPAYRAAKQALGDLQPRAAEVAGLAETCRCLPNGLDRDLLPVLAALGRALLAATTRYDATLDARRALDFSALQIRVSAALPRQPQLVALLQDRHRHVMVDEFQDTDAVQWSIVETIGRPAGQAQGRIFLVGDPQQAIYGFRGGDVTVFRAVEADFEARASPVVILPHNFRSQPTLIDWFNAVFQPILGPAAPDRPPWEAPYQAVASGRPAAGTDGPTVTVMAHADGGGEAARLAEARWVAALLAREALPGLGPFAGLGLADRHRHPAPPVGVLLRRRTLLPALEHALRIEGVPYVVHAGVGFWSRPEVVDTANVLHALAWGDSLSLVGALRSAFFALSDQEIVDLHATGALRGFGTGPLPSGCPKHVADVRGRFRLLKHLRHRLPPSRLVSVLLDTCAGWHAAALGDGRGEANLRRLIALARRWDARPQAGLAEFAEVLVGRIEADSREEEAALAPDEARVVVMTIHAAKGLEFPVVVVPDCGTPPTRRQGRLVAGRLGSEWEVACSVPDVLEGRRTRGSPGLRNALLDRLARERDAEDRRLLYVACTRAKEHLVLVGGRPSTPSVPPRTWLDHLDAVGLGLSSGAVRQLSWIDVEALPAPLAIPKAAHPAPTPEALAAAAPLPARPRPEVNPSSLDLFVSCPARWMRRILLGIPERPPTAAERLRSLAAARGEVIHGLVEDGVVHDEALARRRWWARAYAEGATDEEREAGWTRIRAHLARVAADPTVARLLALPGRSELPFRLSLGDLVLSGVIDRLCREPEGWLVLDWKSGSLDRSAEDEARAYRWQLLVYSLAAERILDEPVRRAALYFTEAGRLHAFPAWIDADFEAVEVRLAEIARFVAAGRPWAQVEREVTHGPTPRPCPTCGYCGRGCRGWREPGERVTAPRSP